MDHKEQRRIIARQAAAKDKRRLIMAAFGLAMCIVVLIVLSKKAEQAEKDLFPLQDNTRLEFTALLPKLDYSVLAMVEDNTDADCVVLEPAAFEELSTAVLILITRWFDVLGSTFDFATGRENSAALRGDLFRLRGKLLDARPITRVGGEDPEYWCQIRTDDGNEFFYVSMMMPEDLFSNDNFVLADGYFFKYYRQRIEDQWITAPLFIGRQLMPSFKREEPTTEPNLELLAGLKDQPIGTHNEVHLLNQLPEMWHLAGVARTLAQDPELMAEKISDLPILDYELLKSLVANPELYRGRMFELGGMIRGTPATVRAAENPIRETMISSAWIRNDSVGDTLIHLKAPGNFPFDKFGSKPTVYHGYFLMLWAYYDSKEVPRRTPVFVVVDSFSEKPYTPPFAGQLILLFLGISVGIGCLLFWLIRKDRRLSDKSVQRLLDRRQKRSGS